MILVLKVSDILSLKAFYSGQEGLKFCKVLIVGAGGLGCPVATYLAGCGVGVIGIVDYDQVHF